MMIIKKRRTWLNMLFSLRGTSLTRTLPRILGITVFSIVITVLESYFGIEIYSLTVTPFALIGVALGIFLGFRNNAAYDRYWEGRKLWGNLVNVSRSYARQVTNFIVSDGDDHRLGDFHREIVYRTIAFVYALRHHLRDTSPRDDLESFLPQEDLERLEDQKNIPLFILRTMGERTRWAWEQGWIDKFHLGILEESLTRMTDIQGGCERIKNTPIPFPYTVLIHRIVAFYCFTLPFGILSTVGVLTPVVVFLISHAFLGLDEIGDEIEDPFGIEPQHLPLTTLCRTIEVNLLQHIDESCVPDLLQPVDDVLS
jgi:putative membrane protein